MDFGKDEIISLKIEDISDTGDGIGKDKGFTWFVKGAVPGDVAEARVTKVKKTYGLAEAVRIVSPSPSRVTPSCPYFSCCGGCQLEALDYPAQLKFKENRIKNQLKRIGALGNTDETVRPVMGMDYPWRYRDNEQFYPGSDEYGRAVFGFYAGHTHEIIELDDCLLGIKENRIILNSIKHYMNENNIRPYDEKTGNGLIGRVQIRKGFVTGDILVCMDMHGPLNALKEPDELIRHLCAAFPETERAAAPHIESVCCRCIDEKRGKGTSRTDDGQNIAVLYGPGTITDRIGDLSFRISPDSFYQVNPLQTERLYRTVLDFAHLTGAETAWDLYCGTGTISLFLACAAGQVYGVETVPGAVDDARDNAKRNGIENVSFFAGKAETVLPEQFEKNHIKADVIVVDPPRKGCGRECLDTMIKMCPDRIVYVSCDGATLARDVKILRGGGYELEKVQPVDQFPQTVHTEAVALLTHR